MELRSWLSLRNFGSEFCVHKAEEFYLVLVSSGLGGAREVFWNILLGVSTVLFFFGSSSVGSGV
jgi:hypothetical protein